MYTNRDKTEEELSSTRSSCNEAKGKFCAAPSKFEIQNKAEDANQEIRQGGDSEFYRSCQRHLKPVAVLLCTSHSVIYSHLPHL